MANALTGDFEALAQIRLGVVDGVLAGFHDSGGIAGMSPSLPHISIANVNETIDAGLVRGTAEIQLAPPTVSLLDAASSEVELHCRIRARFLALPGSIAFPEFVHGEVRAVYSFSVVPWGAGGPALRVTVSGDDSKIAFTPAKGGSLSAAQVKQVTAVVRALLRTRFVAMDVPVPDFAPLGFKILTEGSGVVSVPLNPSAAPAPASALDSVSTVLLNPGDSFVLAVAREYVESLLDPALEPIKAYADTIVLGFEFGTFWEVARYQVSVTSVSVSWQDNRIVLTVTGTAPGHFSALPSWVPIPSWVSDGLAPNFDFEVIQGLVLQLDIPHQTLTLAADGDPQVLGLPDSAANKARGEIIKARNDALAAAQPLIDGVLARKDELSAGFGSPRLTKAQIGPSGIVLRGTISTGGLPQPIHVAYTESLDGVHIDAAQSWLPGGTIDRFVWRMSEFLLFLGKLPVGLVHMEEFEDRFVFRIPEDTEERKFFGDVCLEIEGTRPEAQFFATNGKQCKPGGPSLFPKEIFEEVDPFAQKVGPCPLYKWGLTSDVRGGGGLDLGDVPGGVGEPDPIGPDPRLELLGHLDAASLVSPAGAAEINALLHFMDRPSSDELGSLVEVLSARADDAPPLSLVVVVPEDQHALVGGTLDEALGRLARALKGAVALTADFEGGWSRTFGVTGLPTTLLFDAHGTRAWAHQGPLGGPLLDRALRAHLVPARGLRFRFRGAGTPVGRAAPDFAFEYAPGERLALRRLRGRPVLLVFWKSWSAPCLAELRRLQGHRAAAERGRLFILAVADGQDPAVVDAVRREEGLAITLVPDPSGRIARLYGITGWPTTVYIDARGHVRGVQHGHLRARAPARPPAGPR